MLNLDAIEFILSAHQVSQWPVDAGVEVAFAGRSNVGKSSAINSIFRRKKLAATSRTPGRTQQINFFRISENCRIVDLPGYGFAKVSDRMKAHWTRIIETYLSERQCLAGLFLPMDIRRPLTPLDRTMLEWCQHLGLNIHILLTKSDKLSRAQAQGVLRQTRSQLGEVDGVSIQLFSATKRIGVSQARQLLQTWLESSS